MDRKIKRWITFVGDLVALGVAIIVSWLDFIGVIQLPERFPRYSVTYIAFAVFALYHLYQRFRFSSYRPDLQIVGSGWQKVSRGDRLYLVVHNNPAILSPRADSLSTGALITYIDTESKEVLEQHEDVRWQGTAPPVAKWEYQPYDFWTVNIPAGRRRLLYIAARNEKNKTAYIVSDENYNRDGTFHIEGTEIRNESFVLVKLWSSGYEYRDYSFVYQGGRLIEANLPSDLKRVLEEYEQQ